MVDWRVLSITDGLNIPDEEANPTGGLCGCKAETPTLHELQLMSTPHRWKEMREHERAFFKECLDKVTEYEKDLLAILNLPSINEVRKAVLWDYIVKQNESEAWRYRDGYDSDINAVYQEWTDDLVNTSEGKAIYHFQILSAFAVGVQKTRQQLLRTASPELRDVAETFSVHPSINNDYLKPVVKNGVQRAKDNQIKNLKAVKKGLKKMAKEGRNPIEVARWLHKTTGEGQAWWWLRFVRSESALALNAAFDAQSRELGAKYEEWSTASNPCLICDALSGKVWKLGEGPSPCADTHSSCLCLRIPFYSTDKPVQRRWDRPSPYDVRYTDEEIANLFPF